MHFQRGQLCLLKRGPFRIDPFLLLLKRGPFRIDPFFSGGLVCRKPTGENFQRF